jgi:hypothetical protein
VGCSRLSRRLDQLESWSAGRNARPTIRVTKNEWH